jgi:glycosyltransferase involved in cell wall biosynthesis
MAGWVKALAPDVVYGNTILTFWAMGAAHKLGLPCVWNIRESEEPFSHLDEHSPVVKPFAKECMKYPYQVVFVADATKDLFTPFFNGGNAITIHNGFDRAYFSNCCNHITREEARRQLGLKDDTVYILCVGTICERKGQFDIFDAIRGLDLDSLKKCHLGLVGGDVETDYKKSILATLQTLPQEQRAHITIYNSPGNIDFHYRAADIFICSSRIESFPRTIQEAMSCDLPIITTPVFGIVEQVRNNVSALFYDPGDIVKLQELIKLLMFDAEKRRELGTQAGMTLDILPSTVDMINAYETVFKEAWLSA